MFAWKILDQTSEEFLQSHIRQVSHLYHIYFSHANRGKALQVVRQDNLVLPQGPELGCKRQIPACSDESLGFTDCQLTTELRKWMSSYLPSMGLSRKGFLYHIIILAGHIALFFMVPELQDAWQGGDKKMDKLMQMPVSQWQVTAITFHSHLHSIFSNS